MDWGSRGEHYNVAGEMRSQAKRVSPRPYAFSTFSITHG